MSIYYISTEKSLLDKSKIWDWLRQCFWSENIPLEYVERFIQHSFCFGVYKKSNHEQVGFGRVITDYTTFAYICDIVIEPLCQKQGLGRQLVSSILKHPELQGLKTWSLRTTEPARKIYETLGFKMAESPETHLEIDNIAIYKEVQFVNLFQKS